jgi:NDP-sugar pyrophosphorylase family protein
MSACDNLVTVEHIREMVAMHQRQGATATLSLMPIDVALASKTGVVEWDAPYVRRIVEKPKPEEAPSNISSLPLYVFSPAILEMLAWVQPSPRGELELQDAIQLLIERTGRVMGVLTDTRQQVTDAADLLSLNLHMLNADPAQCICASPLPFDVTLIAPVVIEDGVEIGGGSVIGPGVYIEQGVHIGAGARLQDTLILRGAEVTAGQHVLGEIVAPLSAVAPKSN